MADDRWERLTSAETTLTKALSMAPDHAGAHVAMGAVQIYTNRAAQGIAECERALALDPNFAHAHAVIGLAKIVVGRFEETEAQVQEAIRLSPRDNYLSGWLVIAGVAKFYLGSDGKAVTCFRRSIEINRNNPAAQHFLAAALALLGELEEARCAVRAAAALHPDFTISRFRGGRIEDNPLSGCTVSVYATACARLAVPAGRAPRAASPRFAVEQIVAFGHTNTIAPAMISPRRASSRRSSRILIAT